MKGAGGVGGLTFQYGWLDQYFCLVSQYVNIEIGREREELSYPNRIHIICLQ